MVWGLRCDGIQYAHTGTLSGVVRPYFDFTPRNFPWDNRPEVSKVQEPSQHPVRILSMNGDWLGFDPARGFVALETAISDSGSGGMRKGSDPISLRAGFT